jgi:threonine dehydratase
MQAGNGTLGLEIVEDAPDVTDVFISVGGGGFITGVGTALVALRPEVRIWSVETDGADVLAASLAAGEPVEMTPTSLSTTLGSPYIAPDAFTFAVEHVHRHTVVTDRDAYRAQRLLMERTKVVPELAASCTLAALEANASDFGNSEHVVLVLCGGNVSAAELARYRERFEPS